MDLPIADDEAFETADPIDVAEAVLGSDDRFLCERHDDGDLGFIVKTAWCELRGCFSWRADLPAMLFTVSFELSAPPALAAQAAQLVALVNENIWLGHFELWSEDGSIVYRHAVPMFARGPLAPGEVQGLLAAAMDASDRFYPAFAFLIEGGKSPADAIEAALFETVGEA